VFGVALAVLALAFRRALVNWAVYSAESDLYSHFLLIPLVSLVMIWLRRKEIPRRVESSPGLAAVAVAVGAGTVAAHWGLRAQGVSLSTEDYLALRMVAFLSFVMMGCLATLGWRFVWANLFPVAFLVFMVPLPAFVVEGTTVFLQHASAEAAHALFGLSGTTFFRDGLRFYFPGIEIVVAEQCSGIHSTLVLFITSVIAGRYFLRTPWRRAALAASVLPIGILRNALRIFTISMLSVHVGPEVAHGPLHTQGGHPFFVLSFLMLLALLVLLRKAEAGKRTVPDVPSINPEEQRT
jgi:exosortase C (VPDSG-CTERM-specific)